MVAADDFDGAVRELTGSTTYSADRGTGTVGAKTLVTADGPVIVVNTKVLTDADLTLVERALAHETGHALINGRGEVVEGRRALASSDWAWHLLCIAGSAMQEVRCERAVGELGYSATDSATAEHIVEVLHATTVELLQAIQDPASQDPWVFMQAVMQLLDRLTKVLAYAAAESLRIGEPPAIAAEGALALDAWQEYVAPTWERRLALYEGLPPATAAMSEANWHQSLVEGALLEHDLLRCLGFEFEDSVGGGYGFYRRIDDDRLAKWVRRGLAQEALYEQRESATG
ncbi:hypothetical protein D5H78_18690 [Vallicoccus soli]|uniref:Uncharacterized protein n=1 Tax=Vallicoccus soli TaxID=2339232 RepID=A0A3A3YQM2_9ACTN|nr:hypothetical protein D5H78_18690 [Vallicoccus soli]